MSPETLKLLREQGMLLDPKYDLLANAYNKHKKEIEEKNELIKSVDRYDFLPIVKINNSENTKNAIVSINECENFKKEKISLGVDYDDNKQEYIIADIIITQNSISKIPLKVKRGFDPIGLQDEDGVLKFDCSSETVKLKFIDNDSTDYDEDEKEYSLNKVQYGDEFVLEIDAKKLKRGTSFVITVYASDDNDLFSEKSKRVGICGKFNLKVIEQDLFMEDEIERMRKHFVDNLDKFETPEHTDCITTVNAALRVLFSKKLNLSDRMTRSMDKLRELNMIKESYNIDYLDASDRLCERGSIFKAKKMKDSLSNILLKNNKNKIGYHVYGLAIMDGYHSLILTVDNRNPCETTFILSDQLPENDEYNYTDGWKIIKKKEDLDRWITRKTEAWHKNHDSYAGTLLWKLQR